MQTQTAVEWLYHKLATSSSDELVGNINKWFEHAKQIEKEQMDNAHLDGYKKGFKDSNEELQKYVDSVLKSHVALKNT